MEALEFKRPLSIGMCPPSVGILERIDAGVRRRKGGMPKVNQYIKAFTLPLKFPNQIRS